MLVWPHCRYGAEQGKGDLRAAICEKLYSKAGRKPTEIFVSDGSKCDIGRLQVYSPLQFSFPITELPMRVFMPRYEAWLGEMMSFEMYANASLLNSWTNLFYME